MYYKCDRCDKTFTRSYNLTRHKKESCVSRFDHIDKTKKRKIDTTCSAVNLSCNVCNITVPQNKMLAHERTLQHKNNACVSIGRGVQCIESAFKSRIVTYRINSDFEHVDYTTFFQEIKPRVIGALQDILSRFKSLKVNFVAIGRYFLPTNETSSEKTFNTANEIVTLGSDLNAVYQSFVDVIKNQASEFAEKDSGKF